MRSSLLTVSSVFFVSLTVVMGLSPQEYEQMGRDSAISGNYALAAQNYALAADGYAELGNHSAAAVNHERAATFYSAIGLEDQLKDQASKAASAYGRAGEGFFDEENYLLAANAFARSAALYNSTDMAAEYQIMQAKAGDTYILSAQVAVNLTEKIRSLYWATITFYAFSKDRFEDSIDQLVGAVEDLKDEAVRNRDPIVFDVLEIYYLPIFSQLMDDPLTSAIKMEEMGNLAAEMEYFTFAASYYASAAIFFSSADSGEDAENALDLAATAYEEELRCHETWSYTAFLSLKEYLEQSLYILAHIDRPARIGDLEDLAMGHLEKLAHDLDNKAESLAMTKQYEFASSNYSAAAEVNYVIGNENEFRRLNGLAGWMSLLGGEIADQADNITLAARNYDEAGFLLRIAGNETYQNAYALAAAQHERLANGFIVSGNLTSAATHLYWAAKDFEAADDMTSAIAEYTKYISTLKDIMAFDPQSKGPILVSIGDAQYAKGELEAAEESYAQASDELVQILSAYLSQSPQSLASFPSLPKDLVKSYRLSGRLFLARNTVETLDIPFMYGTLTTLASWAQMYKTAARVHGELAESDISIYDFQSYSVNLLFRGITALMAEDLESAESSLRDFDSINHHFHSFNRKFHQLLIHCLNWRRQGDEGELTQAKSILNEIQSVTDESDMGFLLEDLETFLDTGASSINLSKRASSQAGSGNWKEAGELYWKTGLLLYFAEDYSQSLSDFEDSAYYYIKSCSYPEAMSSSDRAYECILEPTEFVIGLQILSEAFIDSNRTLAGVAKSSFKKALEMDYKPDKSRDLMKIAGKLKGIDWSPIVFQISIGAAGVLTVLAAFVIIRRRTTK